MSSQVLWAILGVLAKCGTVVLRQVTRHRISTIMDQLPVEKVSMETQFLYRSNKPEAVHLVDALLAGDSILGGVWGVGLAKHSCDGKGTEEEGEHGD